jgi:hypothetical protein
MLGYAEAVAELPSSDQAAAEQSPLGTHVPTLAIRRKRQRRQRVLRHKWTCAIEADLRSLRRSRPGERPATRVHRISEPDSHPQAWSPGPGSSGPREQTQHNRRSCRRRSFSNQGWQQLPLFLVPRAGKLGPLRVPRRGQARDRSQIQHPSNTSISILRCVHRRVSRSSIRPLAGFFYINH